MRVCWTMPGVVITVPCLPTGRLGVGSPILWLDLVLIKVKTKYFNFCNIYFICNCNYVLSTEGIVPITCEELFKRVKESQQSGSQYQISVSMLEIYNEQVMIVNEWSRTMRCATHSIDCCWYYGKQYSDIDWMML